MSSWFFDYFSTSSSASSKSYKNYKTLFFAGFVVAAPPTSSNISNKNNEKSNRDNEESNSNAYDINEIRRKLSGKTSPSSDMKNNADDNSLQSLVHDLFEPYGDIDYFYFDYQNGAGVVQYKNGKSGESCYLMSHLLPFTVSTTTATNNNPSSSSSSSTPLSFSLICLEFACLLPFSPASRSLFCSFDDRHQEQIGKNWVTSRKNLDQLIIREDANDHNDDDDLIEDSNWRNHLQFMESQRSKSKLYFKNLSWLRHELMAIDEESDSNSPSLSAEAASELQAHIEQHLATLLFASERKKNNNKSKSNNVDGDEAGDSRNESLRFDALVSSDFWNQILLPSCLDKIVSTLCEIDVEKVGITSPTKKKQNRQVEVAADDEGGGESSQEKRTKLMISMIHSSISILDIWLAIYHTFYCGDLARKEHSSIVAVLESKLIQQTQSSSSSKSSESNNNNNYSLRHPAWPCFAMTHLSEESRLQAVNKNGYSSSINRRMDFIKLFSGGALPIHLGLKQWPGGPSDDVGSAFRAVLAMLVLVKPLYLDQSFRHMWTNLFAGARTNDYSSTASPFFLSQLDENDSKIKKQFLAISSKQEALIEGAWNILYRAGWKMEAAFSLIIAYLSSNNNNRNNNKSTNEASSSSSPNNSSTSSSDFVQKLKSLDSQPSLWNLLRPIDKLENDWNLGRGVLCDEPMVHRRLFDGDEEFAKIKKENEQRSGPNAVQPHFIWESVLEPAISTFLLYGLGQNPAVLYSRYYQRKFFASILGFGPPLFVMLVLGIAIFFFLKLGFDLVVAEYLDFFINEYF